MSAYVTAILQVWWPLTPASVGWSCLSYVYLMHSIRQLENHFIKMGLPLTCHLFDLSAIGDKELGCAILPEDSGVQLFCGQSLCSAIYVWLYIAGT